MRKNMVRNSQKSNMKNIKGDEMDNFRKIDKLLYIESCVHYIISAEIEDIIKGKGHEVSYLTENLEYHIKEIMSNYEE